VLRSIKWLKIKYNLFTRSKEMKDVPQISIQHWVDIIAKSELPAITSTARMLDKFNNDHQYSSVSHAFGIN
jgi:hypothetical protein